MPWQFRSLIDSGAHLLLFWLVFGVLGNEGDEAVCGKWNADDDRQPVWCY